ncbi:MAG: type II toxin-antitoxin system VapC family toxin [Verrucomicrobia bacterium]|nr:type II toxin-antitoxin system VapC family toxin [Verrucomicrobiota bacterium]
MIVLDTHIWVWLVNGDSALSPTKAAVLMPHEPGGFGVSAISCWEVAKLVERGRLVLSLPVAEWLDSALAHPGICLLPLDPEIAVASTQLPASFHKDPADQIIVATARVYDCPLATNDHEILAYPHVRLVWQT